MLKRLVIAAALTVAALVVIDRASLLIAPCVSESQQGNKQTASQNKCAVREGIVVAGIEWLANRSPDTWTALASILIAVFTGTLWCSSEKMWRVTRVATNATRVAARAAQKSADVAEAALTMAERPYLVPKQPKMQIWRYGQPGMPVTMSNPAEYIGLIKYGVVNLGRTVALLKEVTVSLIFVTELPEAPDYRSGFMGLNNRDTRAFIGHFPIKVDGPYDCPDFPVGGKRKIDAETFGRLQKGELKAFLFGYFRYADLFGYLHTEGFCFRYLALGVDQSESACAIVAGKNYNYKRSEKIPSEGFESLSPQGAELTVDDIEALNAQLRGRA